MRVSQTSYGPLAILLIAWNLGQIQLNLFSRFWLILFNDFCPKKCITQRLGFHIALSLQEDALFGGILFQETSHKRAIDGHTFGTMLPLMLSPFL